MESSMSSGVVRIEAVEPTVEVEDAIRLRWLGQGGFLVETTDTRLMIDPYLSDSLARKYAGHEFPHTRMMPPPFEPKDVRSVDAVLCSHRHTDHMDAETLLPIQANCPCCRFVIPRAEREHAVGIGLEPERLICMNAGEKANLGPLTVAAVPAAHEEVVLTAAGEYHHLGYVLMFDDLRLYHSGDCVPTPGLAETLEYMSIDVALLPVNGRDEYRASRGIAGNFTFDEAVELCRQAGIPAMVAHHWGMFGFNTVDPDALREAVARTESPPDVYLPDVEAALAVSAATG
jgi:L-ascorbate metabolism protein UlaG (beta-lactamase superfamily)